MHDESLEFFFILLGTISLCRGHMSSCHHVIAILLHPFSLLLKPRSSAPTNFFLNSHEHGATMEKLVSLLLQFHPFYHIPCPETSHAPLCHTLHRHRLASQDFPLIPRVCAPIQPPALSKSHIYVTRFPPLSHTSFTPRSPSQASWPARWPRRPRPPDYTSSARPSGRAG